MIDGGASAAWLVYACRTSYVGEIAEMIWRCDARILALIDNWPGEPLTDAVAEVVDANAIPKALLGSSVVVAPTVPGHRYQAERDARERGLVSFPVLVDPTAVIARTATLGEGTTVNAAAVIGAATTLGKSVCVNRSVSIGHDCTIEDYATIGPCCALAAFVSVGRGAFLGVGAVCAPKVSIGANATVGAGAVVVRDVAPDTVVVGNPAKPIKTTSDGYGGVSVPH